jgi:hypothetical protein
MQITSPKAHLKSCGFGLGLGLGMQITSPKAHLKSCGFGLGLGLGMQSPQPRLISPLKIMWIWILDVDLECNLLTQKCSSSHLRSCGVWIVGVAEGQDVRERRKKATFGSFLLLLLMLQKE